MTPAFLTGSHAYGKPRLDSDVDLVVYMPDTQAAELLDVLGVVNSNSDYDATGYQFRAGQLNVIICTSEADYWAWRSGTEDLKARAPVTRPEACAHLNALRCPRR